MNIRTFIQQKSSFNFTVISTTLGLVSTLLIAVLFLPQDTQAVLNGVKNAIFQYASWFYIITFSTFLLFLILLSLSAFGGIKLGSNEEEPEFGFISWLAMLFAAGMGVGLMFFGVAEPLAHFATPIAKDNAQKAILHTVFHWGIHAWAIYGIIALALAYFGFRYKLPLALRSCFYPLLKEKINGKIGDAIDIMALIATLFGIITTLGFGAAQMGSGLQQIGWITENSFGLQFVVIIIVMSLAVLSAISGVGKGVKILSETNLVLAISLMLFVLFSGPTLHLLNAFSDNLGTYFGNLVSLSFKTYAYEPENTSWFTGWTVLYWAWWCSWSPFVGLFIARISRGRTIREFIFGVLAIPSLFCVLWFTIFGNSAIWLDTHVAHGALTADGVTSEQLLFLFLNHLPLPTLSSIVALTIISLFFITSADSGIYVLNNIASRDKSLASPRWQAIMWGILMSAVAIALLGVGGLSILQTMTLISALPFTVLMIVMVMALWQGLHNDKKYFETAVNPSSIFWTGELWKERLQRMMNQTQEEDIVQFLKQTALPAMHELKQELVDVYNMNAQINILLTQDEPAVELVITKGTMRDFVYGIKSVRQEIATQLVEDRHLPHIQDAEHYVPMTYFGDGRDGYDVQYMTQKELIADILKQYDLYLNLLANVGQELMSHEQTNIAE
ncbi:BCCT family transporter [Wielerella bovis]|uniref:BCCT family transporter n=1 Tax=Wielerella bovis TaxID=2917790 RepID=UPI00201941BB|nr:BCCT family transporter [Wielerella bovis]MCG7657925.1 BCCT family transporter [Wielerella bovis]MCG7660147.1 BCCT family transporter [Wielerella bovis]